MVPEWGPRLEFRCFMMVETIIKQSAGPKGAVHGPLGGSNNSAQRSRIKFIASLRGLMWPILFTFRGAHLINGFNTQTLTQNFK